MYLNYSAVGKIQGIEDCFSYFVRIDCRGQEQGQDGNEEATENQ